MTLLLAPGPVSHPLRQKSLSVTVPLSLFLSHLPSCGPSLLSHCEISIHTTLSASGSTLSNNLLSTRVPYHCPGHGQKVIDLKGKPDCVLP